MKFKWDEIQRGPDGKTLLLYRQERLFIEGHVCPGMRVLDVGGWGVMSLRLIDEGAIPLILDKFTEDQAYPDRVRALPHVVGDVCDPEVFDADSFDLCVCFETLEHVGDIPAALRSIHKWLRPGAWFVGTVPMPGHIHAGDPTCDVPSPGRLVAELTGAGFRWISTVPSPSVDKADESICTYFKANK